ncbi:MAG: glutathione S-transferase [Gammaproteobacteria bacterium]|nr:glutathione S-transferase [Porticoccaceae bacterium]MBK79286.1 glutathione S-transferase [Gammaproteobacteria bacterium]HAF68425.1 glutathione S-transferase [Acidimicrobiaceae bacterium]
MIDLYFWPTPNGYKASIMLAEVGLLGNVVPVDITAGDQFKSEYLAISPNNKVPAIVDHEGPGGKPIAMFESGAILIYLAEKTGQLLSHDPVVRLETLQWLMFQMGGLGPMLGQAHHFREYAPEPIDYAIQRYTDEAARLYQVLEKRLGTVEYLAGEYSIADVATFPWIRTRKLHGQDLAEYPNVNRWYQAIKVRSSVSEGLSVLAESKQWKAQPGTPEWESMFSSGKQ